MKIPLSWLKEYIEINATPSYLARILTMAGLEVDAIEKISIGCEQVVVCKVIDVQKHPQADKLSLATVFDGQKNYQVVCGASNCRVGLKTALAPVGSTAIDEKGKPFKVKASKIRGVESLGMLCSPQEIGLLDDFEGIIEFSELLKEGLDVAELYNDTVFDISLTPNLGHCSSVIGVAREVSAATGVPVRYPKIELKEILPPSKDGVAIKLSSSEGCLRYAYQLVKNVRVAPSPSWLKGRLEACGVRSINNIVDVTNYVMLEMGHPLHAFDRDLLEGRSLIIRQANPKESFVTLDGKERVLEEQDLLICDENKIIALAGIMGGENSEVSASTKNLLIEAAYFSPSMIRKTSKRLGLSTDASKRFERGTDPNLLSLVLNRVSQLLQEISAGEPNGAIVEESLKEFPRKRVAVRLSRINKLLGTQLSVSEVEAIFARLELNSSWDGLDTFLVTIPTYRNDLCEEIDLVEEVARIYGYSNIKKAAGRAHFSEIPHAPVFLFEREIRSRLMRSGLQEFLTCDLIGPSLLNIVQEEEMPSKSWVKVLNPTSIEQSILRTSLLPGLLQVVKFNWDHQNPTIRGFEIGRIHFKEGDNYKEQSMASVILSGKVSPLHWDGKSEDCDFFDLKGIVETLLAELKVPDLLFKPTALKVFHPGRQAAISVKGLEIGSLGEIHPAVLRKLDVPQRIFFAEINLHDLFSVRKTGVQMQEIPLYPGSERDWTLTVDENLSSREMMDAVKSASSTLLEECSIINVYRSEKLGPKVKNITLRFYYRDRKKTISQEAVEAEHERITTTVLNQLSTKNK